MRSLLVLAAFVSLVSAQPAQRLGVYVDCRQPATCRAGTGWVWVGLMLDSDLVVEDATSTKSNPQFHLRKTGLGSTSQLLDWQFNLASAQKLAFGSGCLPASPCNISIGGVPYGFTNGPYTVALNGCTTHTGSVFVCVSNKGQLTASTNNSLATADLALSSGIVAGACGQDSYQIARWDAAIPQLSQCSTWNTTGYVYAAYASYKPSPVAGSGINVISGQQDQISIDTSGVVRKFACAGGPGAVLPAGATMGDLCWDFAAAPPGQYVCANAAGCTIASDWKSL